MPSRHLRDARWQVRPLGHPPGPAADLRAGETRDEPGSSRLSGTCGLPADVEPGWGDHHAGWADCVRSGLAAPRGPSIARSEEHTSELQSPCNLVCRLLLEKKKKKKSNLSSTQNKKKKKTIKHNITTINK